MPNAQRQCKEQRCRIQKCNLAGRAQDKMIHKEYGQFDEHIMMQTGLTYGGNTR
jgi:hypothetical protein